MDLDSLYGVLSSTGIPTTFGRAPVEEHPTMPYLLYYQEGSRNFAADGIVYFSAKQITIDLYTATKSEAAHDAIGAALTGAEIFYEEPSETYIEGQKCYLTTFQIEV